MKSMKAMMSSVIIARETSMMGIMQDIKHPRVRTTWDNQEQNTSSDEELVSFWIKLNHPAA